MSLLLFSDLFLRKRQRIIFLDPDIILSFRRDDRIIKGERK